METKLCKHCQTEIPKKAKVCPNCRKKQGGIGKWILIAVVLIVLLGSGGESEESSNSGSADNKFDNANKETESNNEKNFIKAGETFEARGIKVTINEVDTDFTNYEDEYGLYELEEGMKYVMVSFTYENTGDSDAYVSIYDYDCYADGTLCEQTYYFDGDFINANISSGRNVSFETYYIVPVDATEIELEYTSNIWTSEKVFIKVQ